MGPGPAEGPATAGAATAIQVAVPAAEAAKLMATRPKAGRVPPHGAALPQFLPWAQPKTGLLPHTRIRPRQAPDHRDYHYPVKRPR